MENEIWKMKYEKCKIKNEKWKIESIMNEDLQNAIKIQ